MSGGGTCHPGDLAGFGSISPSPRARVTAMPPAALREQSGPTDTSASLALTFTDLLRHGRAKTTRLLTGELRLFRWFQTTVHNDQRGMSVIEYSSFALSPFKQRESKRSTKIPVRDSARFTLKLFQRALGRRLHTASVESSGVCVFHTRRRESLEMAESG
ncbi:hypothetical protein AAFF_G00390060 [Aldrovandia affinis]|uniref:Uncharacterized protein n=1 Tax=Aldrovandia affinis TaxID=143900 RepID=A0AAD7SED7_9TELE|nr:hypothetical protein AAFF_G00390060 [Aldrovandia affinis]